MSIVIRNLVNPHSNCSNSYQICCRHSFDLYNVWDDLWIHSKSLFHVIISVIIILICIMVLSTCYQSQPCVSSGVLPFIVYTGYALNWDLREDWGTWICCSILSSGLLHNFKHGKWFLLRSTTVRTPCLLSDAWKYYLAIVNNCILRFFWVLKLTLVRSISNGNC